MQDKLPMKWWYDGKRTLHSETSLCLSLMNLCEEQHRTMHVCIYILDPRDENVCRMYATYSNLVTPGNVSYPSECKMRFAGNHHSSLFFTEEP